MRPYKEIKPFERRAKPKYTYTDGRIMMGEILDEIEIEKGKVKIYKNLVQKIKWDRAQDQLEFRFCYYYNDLNDQDHEWIFGQFACTVTPQEFMLFIEKMKEKRLIQGGLVIITTLRIIL